MIEIILLIGAVAFAIIALCIISGVMVYDIRDIQTKQLFKEHPFTRRYRNRPVVTVLVVADRKIESAHRCLESLKISPYRRLEIIVIDTLASSKLRRLITAYNNTRSRPVRLFKSIRSEQVAINAAYRRYGHGEIVVILNSTDTFDPEAIGRAVWHFNTHKNIATLHTHKLTDSTYSSIGLFQTYIESFMRLSNKLMGIFSYVHNQSNHAPLFYRKDAFLDRHTPGAIRSHFADDVVSYHQPVAPSPRLIKRSLLIKTRQLQSITRRPKTGLSSWYLQRSLMLYIGILLVSIPFLVGYFIFLALVPHQPLPLLLCIGIASLFLLFGLWSDRQRPLSKKLLSSLLIPAGFIPLLLLLFVQLGLYTVAALSLLRMATLGLLPSKKARNAYGYD